MSAPTFSITYKPKGKGTKAAECAAIWLNENDYGQFGSIKPVEQAEDGDYPKIPLTRALELAAEGQGWLNLRINGKGNRVEIVNADDEEF